MYSLPQHFACMLTGAVARVRLVERHTMLRDEFHNTRVHVPIFDKIAFVPLMS